ncbi:MAG: hypothetical protein HYY62_00450 [Deltaproteobacteria bacterium]|nr:hypothetical protein [Deltaproteobacteria bacterium]
MKKLSLFLLFFLFSHSFAFASDPCEDIFDSLRIDFSTGQVTPLNPITIPGDAPIVAARAILIPHDSGGYRAKWTEPSGTFITSRSFSLRTSPTTFEAELTRDLKILKLKAITPDAFQGYEEVSHADFAQGNMSVIASWQPFKRKLAPLDLKQRNYGELTFQYDDKGNLIHIDHSANSYARMISVGNDNPSVFRNISSVHISRSPTRLLIEGQNPHDDEIFVAMTNALSAAKEAFEKAKTDLSSQSDMASKIFNHYEEVISFLDLSEEDQLAFVFQKQGPELEFWEFIRTLAERGPTFKEKLRAAKNEAEAYKEASQLEGEAGVLSDLERIGQIAELKQAMQAWGFGSKWKMDVSLGKNYGPHPDIPFMKMERHITVFSEEKEARRQGWVLHHYEFYYDGIEENSGYFLLRVVQREFIKPDINAADTKISPPQTTWLRFYHDPNWGHQRYLRLMSVMNNGSENWIEETAELRKALKNGLSYIFYDFFKPHRAPVCWMNLGVHEPVMGLEFRSVYLGAVLESLFTHDGRLEAVDLEVLRHLYRFPKEKD